MGLSDDWRERYGQKSSPGKVYIYIVILLIILFIIAKSGDYSKRFSNIFLDTQNSTTVETTE